MDIISSAEFRKTYAKLTSSTIVTANGHVIGVWSPREAMPPDRSTPSGFGIATSRGVEPLFVHMDNIPDGPAPKPMTQPERDAILRKVNRG